MAKRETIAELGSLIDQGKLSCEELVREALRRVDQGRENFGPVFLSVRAQAAISEAQAADQRRRQGKPLSPLDGLPVAIKDNIAVAHEPLTCASQFLREYRSPYDATVTQRLKAAGAVIIGKPNLDEFAMGSSNENSSFGTPRNPWNPQCVPGGSSGGSAVSVAAAMACASLGSDTGGSIRLPASFCGLVGVKPTYGRVSRYGLVAFGSSLDQIGPMSWWVEDAATLFNVIAGYDVHDSTCIDRPLVQPRWGSSLKGLRLGIPKEYLPAAIDPEVGSMFSQALDQLKKLGAVPVEISMPHTEYAIGCYYVVASAEASANLARFDGVRYTQRAKAVAGEKLSLRDLFIESRSQGFGAEVKRRIMLGTFVLSSGYSSAYYARAQKVRGLIRGDFDQAFKECDMILTPTSPSAAFKLGEKADDPLTMYLSDIFTTPANLAGVPGITVNGGFSKSGLPLGLQFLGRPFDEARLFEVAQQFEQATGWREQMPAAGFGAFYGK